MGAYSMTERKLLTLDDFVKQPTTYTRFGEKVTRNPIEQVYNAGLLKDYKQLSVSHKYIRFTGMQEEADGGEGWYIRDDNIAEEEDIGVIIYIGQYKYRRLYGAYVLVDWFYTGDFGIALQRACKYASVRCIAGKVYECNSEITLKLDVRGYSTTHGLGHGHLDYGHVIIDLRGATINYNVENSSFCFNIRIYNRETKFMLTNGNFNVSDLAKLTLKNIANVIGGNNYTDMLTDMHYNVDKELLPDTNKVVLFSDPTIEGVKTFEKAFNYTGEGDSAGDDYAVTKDYMPANINEEAYIALNDSRKIEGILAFDKIVDNMIGNLVGEAAVSDVVLEASTTVLNGLMQTADIGIYLPFMYYVKHIQAVAPDIISGGRWEEQLLLAGAKYQVFKQQQSTYIIIPQARVIVDENEIGEDIYIKCRLNKPIIVDSDTVKSIKVTTTTPAIFHTLQANKVADSITVFTHAATISDELREKLVEEYIAPKNSVIYLPIIIPTPRYDQVSMNWPYGMDVKTLCHYAGYLIYKGIDDVNYIIPCTSISRKYIAPHIRHYCHSSIGYFELLKVDVPGTANNYYPITFNNLKYISDIMLTEASDITEYRQISDTNFGISLNNINIRYGSEYISITAYQIVALLKSQWDGPTMDEYSNPDITHYIDEFYVKCVVPVQANLEPFLTENSTKACASLNFVFVYNKEIINTSYIDIYIPRYISRGVPEYELPSDIRVGCLKEVINIRYPTSFIYANNSCIPKKFRVCNQTSINDQGYWVYRASGSSGGKNVDMDGKSYCYTTGITKDVHSNTTLYVKTVDNKTVHAPSVTWQFGIGASIKCRDRVCENGEGSCSQYFVGPILCIPGYNYSYTGRVSGDQGITSKITNLAIRGFSNIIEFTLNPGEVKVISTYAFNSANSSKYTEVNKNFGPYTASSSSDHCSRCAGMSGGFRNIYITATGAASYFLSFNTGLNKNKLLNRLFGVGGFSEYILRDGILKDPFRERTIRPEHQFAAPVGALNP